MKSMYRGGLALAVVSLLTGMATPVGAANKVILTNGREMVAKTIQWRESAQEYRVETPDGTVLPLPKAQVDRLEIDKPAEYDKAAQMIAAKQFDASIPVLDDLVARFKMLVWDNEARKLLAVAYMGKNDPKKAAGTLDEYFTLVPKAQVPADVQLIYWNALLAADRASSLKKDLDEVIATGPREMAAAAQIMRGNMNRQAGQKEAATLDYLRVVVLYENVKSVQPEALYKAAEMLEELRDARAETLRKKLVQEYKDSEWAAKLSGKI